MSERDLPDLKSHQLKGDSVLEECYDGGRILKKGDSGSAVKKIQQALIDLGFCSSDFKADEEFGDKTVAKVKEFQMAYRLIADGIIGSDTIKILDYELLCSSAPFSIEYLMKFIERWEGRKYTKYLDSRGIATIGVGFNLMRSDARDKIGTDYDRVLAGEQSLSDKLIDKLLSADAQSALDSAGRIVAKFDELPDNAKFIVADMVFNLGASGFAGFRRAIAALDVRDFATAANEMEDSEWYRQTGIRSGRHVRTMRVLAAVCV